MHKQNRIKTCQRCPRYRACGAWTWPRCFSGLLNDANPARALELSDDFMGDAASECPAGKWLGVDFPEVLDMFAAKRAVCATCEHSRMTAPYDLNLCVCSETTQQRDSEFMNGPAANCPAGKWDGLTPPLMTLPPEQARLRTAERQRARLGPVLVRVLFDLSDKDERLARLIEDGRLEVEAATAISESRINHDEGQRLDVR